VTSGRNYTVENNNGGLKYLKQNSSTGTGPALAMLVLVLMLIATSIAPYSVPAVCPFGEQN
jgi:hypothetical protein